jgi:hypothetical protein
MREGERIGERVEGVESRERGCNELGLDSSFIH